MSDQSRGPGWWMASDGKWYPPLPAPPPAARLSPNATAAAGCLKSAAVAVVVVIAVMVVLAIVDALSIDDVGEGRQSREERVAADVELLGCVPSEHGWMAAQVRVTNNSSERSNYIVEVAFTSEDEVEQFATASVLVSALQPGQAASEVASTAQDPPGVFVCDVVDVTRFSDE